MQNTNEIDELIKLISKLPGLGPKSAKRIVLKLINNRDELVKHVYDITYGSIKKTDNLVIVDDSIVRGTTLQKSILKKS